MCRRCAPKGPGFEPPCAAGECTELVRILLLARRRPRGARPRIAAQRGGGAAGAAGCGVGAARGATGCAAALQRIPPQVLLGLVRHEGRTEDGQPRRALRRRRRRLGRLRHRHRLHSGRPLRHLLLDVAARLTLITRRRRRHLRRRRRRCGGLLRRPQRLQLRRRRRLRRAPPLRLLALPGLGVVELRLQRRELHRHGVGRLGCRRPRRGLRRRRRSRLPERALLRLRRSGRRLVGGLAPRACRRLACR